MIDKLHYISQPAADGSHLTAIKNALEAGCKWIQLRIKDQSTDNILPYASEAAAMCGAYQAKLIINDHPEIALKSGADGVHLGLDDMSIADARAIVGPEFIIGGTANTFADVARRAAAGVDYVGLGPYRFTTTKKQLSPILGASGYESIMQQCKENNIKIPIIAIGGIEEVDVPLVMQTGVYGVAVSGAITHSADRAATVKEMYQHLNTQTTNSEVNL